MWSPCWGQCRRVALVLSFANKVLKAGAVGRWGWGLEIGDLRGDLALCLLTAAASRLRTTGGTLDVTVL